VKKEENFNADEPKEEEEEYSEDDTN